MESSGAPPDGGRPGRLPGFLAEVEGVAGANAAIAVALELGGEEIHIPQPARILRDPPRRRAKLLNLLGEDGAIALAERMGGCSVYVPFARRAVARMMRARGGDVEEIACAMLVSRRQIRRYLRGP